MALSRKSAYELAQELVAAVERESREGWAVAEETVVACERIIDLAHAKGES